MIYMGIFNASQSQNLIVIDAEKIRAICCIKKHFPILYIHSRKSNDNTSGNRETHSKVSAADCPYCTGNPGIVSNTNIATFIRKSI